MNKLDDLLQKITLLCQEIQFWAKKHYAREAETTTLDRAIAAEAGRENRHPER